MTGQVKEEILTRLGELGVEVAHGRVAFRPRLLRASELVAGPATFEAVSHDGTPLPVAVPAGGLAFTLCQVPVVYSRTDGPAWIRVVNADGSSARRAGDSLDPSESRALLDRAGALARVEVGVPASSLRAG